MVQWGHWLQKSLLKNKPQTDAVRVSLPNGFYPTSCWWKNTTKRIYSQLRNPKPPFLNVRIRIICWNTRWTVNYIFIISYFVGISFFSVRNWKGLTLTFSSPVHRPLAKQMGGPPRAKELLEFGSQVIQLGNLETEAPELWIHLLLSPLVFWMLNLSLEIANGKGED